MTYSGSRILIADDEKDICDLLSECMAREGLTPVVVHTGTAALEKIRSEPPDALIVALKVPDIDGMEVLHTAKALDEDLPVILITGYPEIRTAVAAMRAGAHDYLAKPVKHHEVLRVVFRALNERALKNKIRHLSSKIEDESSLREFMGPSDAVSRLMSDVSRVARTNFSVVLQGETGSGKEVVARAIHQLSPRFKAPFIALDCGALPETLLESELFGHDKGAFTGADKQKAGMFEMAHGGTLLLDEICNMPLGSQAKLLRVLQEKRIYHIGGTRPIGTDVRVLAAGNRDLHKLGEAGLFRRDVYFRLNEFTISIPPLRERKEDILYLAKRFLDQTNLELQKNVLNFTQAAVDALLAYGWPGNIRQLRSAIRRAVLLADDMITEKHLGIEPVLSLPQALSSDGSPLGEPSNGGQSLKEMMRRYTIAVEREILVRTLRETGGNKAKAARLLQIDYKTIHLKVKEYGISVD